MFSSQPPPPPLCSSLSILFPLLLHREELLIQAFYKKLFSPSIQKKIQQKKKLLLKELQKWVRRWQTWLQSRVYVVFVGKKLQDTNTNTTEMQTFLSWPWQNFLAPIEAYSKASDESKDNPKDSSYLEMAM